MATSLLTVSDCQESAHTHPSLINQPGHKGEDSKEAEGTGAADMTSYIENSPILKPPQDVPEGHWASYFEHMAQMNMFGDTSTLLRILPKICLVKVSAEEDPKPSGLGDTNFKVPDPADSASFKNCNGCKLFNIVRRDLQLSDGEDSESENAARPSLKQTSKKEREACREKEKTEEDHENEDSAEWAKARKKVEEFLDFPALISAMNFRNKTESSMFSQNSSTSSRQQMACREALSGITPPVTVTGAIEEVSVDAAQLPLPPQSCFLQRRPPLPSGTAVPVVQQCGHQTVDSSAPIPNTRHNAVFLRDNPKAAQVILASPYHNGEYLRTQDKRDGDEYLKGDLPPKKVLNLAENSNTKMEPETNADS